MEAGESLPVNPIPAKGAEDRPPYFFLFPAENHA
jgi:hypothetical protein